MLRLGKTVVLFLMVVMVSSWGTESLFAEIHRAAFAPETKRQWLGPEYWANRIQDWQINNERIECVSRESLRTCHLLTRRIGDAKGEVVMKVKTGGIHEKKSGSSGFLFGAGHADLDYRAAAMVMQSEGPYGGFYAGISKNGRIFIKDFSGQRHDTYSNNYLDQNEIELELQIIPGWFRYKILLKAKDIKSGLLQAELFMNGVRSENLIGNIGLVSDGRASWFSDWEVSGSKLLVFNDRLAGPIMATKYSLQNNYMRMSAQMMPLGQNEGDQVHLQIKKNNEWTQIAKGRFAAPDYVATFAVPHWQPGHDMPYRVVYDMKREKGVKQYEFKGVIRNDPVEKEDIVCVAIQGNHHFNRGLSEEGFIWDNNNVWFPHGDVTKNIQSQEPDVLFFLGNQIGRGDEFLHSSYDDGALDEMHYLHKWYMWCWSFRNLTRNIPSYVLTNEQQVVHHLKSDVLTKNESFPAKDGSVKKSISITMKMNDEQWHELIWKTQRSHMSGSYSERAYSSFAYGRIGFMVMDDHRYKSTRLTSSANNLSQNGFLYNTDLRLDQFDQEKATLLGENQLKYIKKWNQNWKGQDLKIALMANAPFDLVTHLGADLKRVRVNVMSSAWPMKARTEMLKELRKSFSCIISGGMNPASVIQTGIEAFDDACYSFSIPSLVRTEESAWLPDSEAARQKNSDHPWLGHHMDNFGNKINVHAVINPATVKDESTGMDPPELHDLMPGYGVIRVNKYKRTVSFEAWPRYANPDSRRGMRMYKGTPVTISQEENYEREAKAYLPLIEVKGWKNPVIQILDEKSNEVVYTTRMRSQTFIPKVFHEGFYTIIIGGHDHQMKKIFKNVKTLGDDEDEKVLIIDARDVNGHHSKAH